MPRGVPPDPAAARRPSRPDAAAERFLQRLALKKKSAHFADLARAPRPSAPILKMAESGRVLAIDPSLRGTGFAVLESAGTKVVALTFGTIKNAPTLLPSGCLVAIHERVCELLAEYQPACAAFEGVIFVQSHRTAITLGAARGAALLAAAARGLPIYEYAPRRVKQSVVGRGAADKGQIGFMVRALLGLQETPTPDAADALAIGLTHLQAVRTANVGATQMERI